MERRFILFIVITFVIMGSYPFLLERFGFAPTPPVPEPVGEVRQNDSPRERTKLPSFGEPEEITAETREFESRNRVPKNITEEEIIIETPLYRAKFSSRGAELLLWELKSHTKEDRETPIVLFSKKTAVSPSFSIKTGDPEIDRFLREENYAVEGDRRIVLRPGQEKELIFRIEDAEKGIFLAKRFSFSGDTYQVNVKIEVEGVDRVLFGLGSDFGITNWGSETRGFIGFIGPVTFADEESIKDKPGDIEGEIRHRGKILWTSLQDKYFIAAAIPQQTATAVVWRPNEETVEAGLEFDVPRGGGTATLIVFAGPKELDRLEAMGVQLENSIDFGWFMFGSWGIVRFLAEPLFHVLRFFEGYTGNFGVSIILLTICVRIIFIPLTHKAYSSMRSMQVLQPQLKVLQKKYKDDRQTLQKEMLALYQENKVNPLGGCLPMLLQMPIFVALFNVLYNTIELRQAPFYLWIHDLSLSDPYYFYPVVMGATMFLQQKLQPVALEPTQAKIMMLMPVFITFLFLTFPSGLVIYMLTNNVLTITQQYFTMKHFDKTRAKPKESEPAPEETKALPVPHPGGGKKTRQKKRKPGKNKP